ncbi:MAG: hypothetical protein AAF658_21425 [Myxococcota bacterium]
MDPGVRSSSASLPEPIAEEASSAETSEDLMGEIPSKPDESTVAGSVREDAARDGAARGDAARDDAARDGSPLGDWA